MTAAESNRSIPDTQFLSPEEFDDAPSSSYTHDVVWPNVLIYAGLHLSALYGGFLLLTTASWPTVIFCLLLYVYSGLGVTAGAHRLWAHRSYKAKTPLRYILAVANVLAFENDVIEWSRDHRGHHKWSETSADPHNVNRGVFFAHIGWLLVKKHPDVIRKGKTVDLTDLHADHVLRWQRRNYWSLALLICVLLPVGIPNLVWGESLWVAYFVAVFRFTLLLHATWCVNSVAHIFGSRPYDADISPTQNIITTLMALGEGWHNYHHTFPQDYRAAELPWTLNFTTIFIDFFAKIGWAYDMKITDQSKVEDKKAKTILAEKEFRRHRRERSSG